MVDVRQEDGAQHYMMFWIGSIFHQYTYIRGAENALIDVAEQRPEFFSLVERLYEFLLKRIKILSGYDLDGLFIADDWGSQQAMMIDPAQWRKIFKPYYRGLAEAIHDSGFFAHYHTCGYTLPILSDLIDCGFDGINPQVSLMDTKKIAKIFKEKTSIRPDLERQGILMRGTPDEVAEHVSETFQIFKSFRGGYIGHIPVEMNVSPANVEAMMKTYREASFN